MKVEASTKVVIDRIEGDLAVVALYDDDQVKFNLPVRYLPDGAREGDHLRMSFEQDEISRETDKKRIDDLLRELKSR
ncbi:MAG TPA: DUF3006 domain-containing protein [Blastocatellia bacterium]|nr:DUF3006 domain-containing protein [Blastocatellia bacterium]